MLLCAYLCFSLLNICMKTLYASYSAMQITSMRSFFCIVLFGTAMLLLPGIRRDFFKGPTRVNIYKSIFDFLSTPAWVLAVANINIANAVALSQVTPILAAIFAIIFLKDKMSLDRWIAVFIGIIGALVILRPASEGFNEYSFVVLFTCFLWASSNVMTKFLAGHKAQQPLVIVVYSNIMIFLLTIPSVIFEFRMPDLQGIFVSLQMSLLAGLGYICIAYSCRFANISVLAPFDCFRLLFATIAAYVFFGQVIDGTTLLGAAIIFTSTTYLAMKHARKAGKPD